MQTIQLKVHDSSLDVVMTLLGSLKKDIVQEVKVFKPKNTTEKTDIEKKLFEAKGILKNRIPDPMEYQRTLRNEWDRA